MNLPAVLRLLVARAVRPLHQDDARRVEQIVPAERVDGFAGAEPEEVDVEDLKPSRALVPLYEREAG